MITNTLAIIFLLKLSSKPISMLPDRAGVRGGQGGLAPPIDMLGPLNEQAYSFEISDFGA